MSEMSDGAQLIKNRISGLKFVRRKTAPVKWTGPLGHKIKTYLILLEQLFKIKPSLFLSDK